MGYEEGANGIVNSASSGISSRKDARSSDAGDINERSHAPTHMKRQVPSRDDSRDSRDSIPLRYSTSSSSTAETSQLYTMENASKKRKNEDNEDGRPGSKRNGHKYPAIISDDGPSHLEREHAPFGETRISESHRVPYFRYFGPTAIVPGFKQMVVSVRENRRSTGAPSSGSLTMSPMSAQYSSADSVRGGTPPHAGAEPRTAIDMPIYDPNDSLPVNRLIIHLVEVFFARLGCNYPFLSKRQHKFKRLVEEKKIEPILVDAVCGLAARFSDHPLLTTSHESPHPKSEYGRVFAQRAKAAVVETFPCPTVGAVQACLLLAYEGFGANQDSALWMYLGCAIRMAVDLGLQKLDGVKHQGQKDPGYLRTLANDGESDEPAAEEKNEIEEERIDTLWAVLMLDRVISSGTGRTVSLKDEDLELTLPSVSNNTEAAWPDPFPALIRIIHLYGRVSDLLNRIRGVDDVTQGLIKQLSGMEKDSTMLYQSLDARLGFTATNFQHYVKSGEGTNFILVSFFVLFDKCGQFGLIKIKVHFWFHTLIMLLHQPTLMHSFEGQVLQLLPHSRELSMSSAKTITDILAFAELIDPRSFIGNPFTCQPIYVAGCAFLKEIALQTSRPSSRDASPRNSPPTDVEKSNGHQGNQQKQKHSLLAAAANQNYQQCHKALQLIETYWAGTRYIRVAMEQKQSGIDPQEVETYTAEEYTEATTRPRQGLIPSWRKKFTNSPSLNDIGSPIVDPGQAIGWSLTGTTNSPSSNLTFMFQNQSVVENAQPKEYGQGNMIYDPIRPNQMPPPTSRFIHGMNQDATANAEAEMLLGLGEVNSAYHTPASSSHHDLGPGNTLSPRPGSASTTGGGGGYDFHHAAAGQTQIFNNHSHGNSNAMNGHGNGNGEDIHIGNGYAAHAHAHTNGYMGMGIGANMVGDMMMQSQDIDMRGWGEDMMPWLEY